MLCPSRNHVAALFLTMWKVCGREQADRVLAPEIGMLVLDVILIVRQKEGDFKLNNANHVI